MALCHPPTMRGEGERVTNGCYHFATQLLKIGRDKAARLGLGRVPDDLFRHTL
jgi:hypothetical protein